VIVRIPVTAQATSIQPGLPISLDISAEDDENARADHGAITTMVASNRFRPRTKPRSRAVGSALLHGRLRAYCIRKPVIRGLQLEPLKGLNRRGFAAVLAGAGVAAAAPPQPPPRRSGPPPEVPPFQAPIEFARQDVPAGCTLFP